MTDNRPRGPDDAPAQEALGTLAIGAFVIGLALGFVQPLFVADVGATLVAGPTYLGLLFLLCLAIALVMGVLALFGARWFTVPVFVVSGLLALGLFAGFWVAASFSVGFASGRHAATTPTHVPSAVHMPVVRKAPATVGIRLDGVPGFTPNAGDRRYTAVDAAGNIVADGVWGQWCNSGPDTEEVASIDAWDVGMLGEARIRVTLFAEQPTSLPGSSMALPRVWIQLFQPDGSVPTQWAGQGQVVAVDRSSGRVAFTGLAADPSGTPATLTGELSWACSDWIPETP